MDLVNLSRNQLIDPNSDMYCIMTAIGGSWGMHGWGTQGPKKDSQIIQNTNVSIKRTSAPATAKPEPVVVQGKGAEAQKEGDQQQRGHVEGVDQNNIEEAERKGKG